jgi:hypothetical protein
MTLNNLTVLSRACGWRIVAETMRRRWAPIFEKLSGLEHPNVIIPRKKFASLTQKIGQSLPQPLLYSLIKEVT